uniref:FERM and PDZ domain-containing protein 2 isoform X3 n=1 Tax=Pogona vitticeps TaxID=103695 RepID=A0ABM5FZW2_9SAUR
MLTEMSTTITLAEILHTKGSPLEEEEIWALLLLGAQRLLEDIRREPAYIICPWSVLLSTEGTLSFRDNISQTNLAPFKAPEILCDHNIIKHCGLTEMLVYSLGMTLYWSADYQIPASQPLQLSDELHTVLLMLCEDLPQKRLSLESILETCEAHQMQSQFPANVLIQKLVESAFESIKEVEQGIAEDTVHDPLDRSNAVRKRLHEKVAENSVSSSQENLYQGRTPQTQESWESSCSDLRTPSSYKLFINRSASGMDEILNSTQKSNRPHDVLSSGSSSAFSISPKDSLPAPASSRYVFQRKEKFSGPEFIILSNEPPVTLHLPGSIVTKKGKSYLSQRDVSVILLNGQCLEVKCDIKSKARDIFNTVVIYANIVEHSYFGLAYMRGKEFFFLDDDTKLYKVAPEGWNDKHKKKTSIVNFTVFLRIKFFVDDFSVIQHGLTRHQFYLQLRKDLLDEHLSCNIETALQLGALALQAELGNYAPEVHGKTYFRVEDYIPASQIKKMTLEFIQHELAKLHRTTHSLFEEEAELEFLKVIQQLSEYGVLFYRVFHEKKTVGGDLLLGICAKGIIVYEVKNHIRISSLRFQWQEMERISAQKKKFMIESSFTGKKYTFLTDTVKTCKYLLDLCSAQHGFNAHMTSKKLLQAPSEDCRFMEIVRSSSAFTCPRDNLNLIQRLSCSENLLYGTSPGCVSTGIISKSCDNLSMQPSHEKSSQSSAPSRLSQSELTISLNENQRSCNYLSINSSQNTAAGASGLPSPQMENSVTRVEKEIICVTLKRDPKCGFGFVIIGGENVGKLDFGIFIASVIPGGPADRCGHIKPGGRLISVNSISLEGVSFNIAVKIIQNSPDDVELIISQPKDFSEEGLNAERNLLRKVGSTSDSEISCIDYERQITEDSQVEPTEEEGVPPDNEPEKLLWHNVTPRIPIVSITSLESQEGISAGVPNGEICKKSIIPDEPGDKGNQSRKGDSLWKENGLSLQDHTQRHSMESLKRSGQVSKLIAARESQLSLPKHPSPGNNANKDSRLSHSLATALVSEDPESVCFMKDGIGKVFEVTLRKNSGGLGFSFLQMSTCKPFGTDIVRIKRLFPGQPAEENGEIEVGDIILAVNGKSVHGLMYQEVLHLLRGAPSEVTLHLCRPPKGTLPEIDQRELTPLSSPVKELVTSLEQTCGLNHNPCSEEDCTSPVESLRKGHDKKVMDVQHSPCREQNARIYPSLIKNASPALRSYKHLWKVHQKAITSKTFLSLEEEMTQGCTSPLELERPQSLVFDQSDSDQSFKYSQTEILSSIPVDEQYLISKPTSITPLLHEERSEVGTSEEQDELGPSIVTSTSREECVGDRTWDDLEEVKTDVQKWGNVRETEFHVTLTRSVNKGYGFTVVVNKMENTVHIAEILGEPALSDGRLRRGDRLRMVNGIDVTTIPSEEVMALLYCSPHELSLVVCRIIQENSTSFSPDEIPEIIITKGRHGQLGLKLTGGTGSKLQGLFVLEIVPESPASQEGSLQPHDQIISICGFWTEDMSLDDAVSVCEAVSQNVHIRAIRNGQPVIPLRLQNKLLTETVNMKASSVSEPENLQDQHLLNMQTKLLAEDSLTSEPHISDSAAHENCIINVELEKSATGSLGFALVGGRNGRAILIKAISPGSTADLDGRLRVGDILLKVNGHLVSGLTRSTVIDILRKAHSTVQLTVCRSAALRWAYLGGQPEESPLQNESSINIGEGSRVLGAQQDLTFQAQERSIQMCSKESDNQSISPVKDHGPEYAEHISDSPQNYNLNTQHMLPKAEPDEHMNDEEEDIARRLAVLCRGSALVSEEELIHLSQIKPSQSKSSQRYHTENLIHKLQRQIEQHEILKEFVDLEHLKPLDDCQVAKAPENREKNRYRDILPYDLTRVPLGEMKGYINASYIRVPVDKDELFYISTQGPLACTTNDFWQMVWENHSNVIAMITRETEHGISKCHRYWPEPPHVSMDLIQFQLQLINYQILDCFVIRLVELVSKQTQERRIVYHLQFTTWPDHGTPRSSKHLVKFVRYMRKIHQTGPIIAHCSAGIGRSGVLLCVDILLRYIEKDIYFDIKQIVTHLRHQRFGMIQTKEQYMFCYEIALEVLKNIQSMGSQLLQ